MSGADVRLLETGYDTADVSGIADKAVENLPIATCAGLVESTTGPIVVIMHQYAHYGKGKTIHSVNQLLHFGVEVDATPRLFGGKQRIRTSSGHVVPLHIRNGLAYMDMSPPTDRDMETYPTVFLTSDNTWDPNSFDDDYATEDVEVEEMDTVPDYRTETVNDYGELLTRSSAACSTAHFIEVLTNCRQPLLQMAHQKLHSATTWMTACIKSTVRGTQLTVRTTTSKRRRHFVEALMNCRQSRK